MSKAFINAFISVIKFQLKLLLIMGFCVELDTCLCCRERVLDEEMYFSSKMGGIVCKECNEHLGVKLKMHHKIRDFLEAMLQFDFNYKSEYDEKANEKIEDIFYSEDGTAPVNCNVQVKGYVVKKLTKAS
jgi:recombinational DNA repair protein (RecF pathway)